MQEFEIIAQIKLFQGAAKSYVITPDEEFRLWFDNIKTFSEGERSVGASFGLNELFTSASWTKRVAAPLFIRAPWR